MILHERASETMEREADEFASALLMPAADIRPYLNDLTPRKAAALKPQWRVSMAALLRRAKDLHCITADRYTDHVRWMSARGYRRLEPYPIAPEKPRTVGRLIDAYIREAEYDWSDIGEMMDLLPDEARHLYGPFDGPRLAV